VLDEIKKSKFKKGENMPEYKGKLMIMKTKAKKDICLTSITHVEKLVQTRFRDQDFKKPRAVDYYSIMGGVDMSDA
jgi:hypothetical protein